MILLYDFCHYLVSISSNKLDSFRILFFYRSIAGVLTYFSAGLLINMLAFKKTGLEMIPQKQLWFSLPFLIKVIIIAQYKHSLKNFGSVFTSQWLSLFMMFFILGWGHVYTVSIDKTLQKGLWITQLTDKMFCWSFESL